MAKVQVIGMFFIALTARLFGCRVGNVRRHAALDPAVSRFTVRQRDDESEAEEWRGKLQAFRLTPGVFLRMGDRSAIRTIANDLADTRVQLETGSVIVDSGEPNLNTSVTLIYKSWRIHFLQKGSYRIDADPPRLWVHQGQAEVFSGVSEQPVSVEQGMRVPFASVLVPEQGSDQPKDALSDWSTGRRESITADNAITAQLGEDAVPGVSGSDSFAYYPFLGLSSLGLSSVGPYSPYLPRQSGFNSIYLPGYTSQPLLLGTMVLRPFGRRFPTSPLSVPRVGVAPGAGHITPLPRIGVAPGAGYTAPFPRVGVVRGAGQVTPVPRAPVLRPRPTHAPPAIGVRSGSHR